MYKNLKDSLFGCTVGLAIGDALGVPFEFKSKQFVMEAKIKNMTGGGFHNQPAGTWSDDTSMMLALMDGLCERRFELENISNRFLKWYNKGKYSSRGKAFDIGKTTKEALNKLNKGVPPFESGSTSFTENGNGSLMRTAPLSYFLINEEDLYKIKDTIEKVSAITHASDISKLACVLYNLIILKMFDESDKRRIFVLACKDFKKLYERHPDFNKFSQIINNLLTVNNTNKLLANSYVLNTLESSIYCFLNTESFENAVLMGINLGEDTDTTGAVCGGLAGAYYGYEAIPHRWKKQLHKEEYVKSLTNKFYKRIK